MRFWKNFLVGFVAVVVCFATPISTYATSSKLTEKDLFFYGQNGIYFYLPGNGKNCFGTLTGSTIFEKVLSGLLSMGLNDVAAAGVYSNMMAEGFGGGSLLRHEEGVNDSSDIGTRYTAATYYGEDGLLVEEKDVRDLYNPNVMHGLGPVGWSFGARVLLLEKLEEYGVEQYATEWDDAKGHYVYDRMSYDQMVVTLGEKTTDQILVAILDFFDDFYLKNDYDGYNYAVTQDDIDAQGLSKYGVTVGMTLLEALNLVSTPEEAAELFFTTGEMPGFTQFNDSQRVHADRANEGLELIKSAGLTASGVGFCSGNGDITSTALGLAWDIEAEGKHDKDDPKPEYELAMKSVGTWYASGPCGSSGVCAPNGASCDIFVSTVMRYSGVDKNFPEYGPGVQQNYMASHSELYEEIDNLKDTSNLEAGDIFVIYNGTDSHIFIYMGVEDGKWMQASASFNNRTGEYFSYEEYNRGAELYRIFRKV